ncbi:hypothetical protein L484_022322 [Morus notabilis]|uniref:Uncharacterized protein n=1 Tax=Morus notabilis TaxID=981085 RepID=W9QRK1_9ROSA|nr:hypothetical protein L484_022322 [Morus notabilis]
MTAGKGDSDLAMTKKGGSDFATTGKVGSHSCNGKGWWVGLDLEMQGDEIVCIVREVVGDRVLEVVGSFETMLGF